jgi:2-hydroxy-3-oxopropionate reductase
MKQVGFIGLGTMGAPMASHLAAAGYPLWVCDLDPERMDDAVDAGALACADPRAVAEHCELLVLMVLNLNDVESALFGARGAADGLAPGSLVIIMSTIPAEAVRDIAERLADRSVSVIDAPVSGGKEGAQAADLTIMVGGTDADFRRAMPLLKQLGKNITHVGDCGSGQVAKSANQVIVALNRAAVGEALLLAARAGADPETVRRALMGGHAQSATLENYGARMTAAEHPVEFGSAVISKDLKLVVDMAGALGLHLPFTELVAKCYRDSES